MSFNFPNTPTEGQEYIAVPGGATYIYKSGIWMLKATEAPVDGNTYGRQNNMWVPVATTASPTLTGDPKAPTPATPDNDTSIATTAFVKNQAYLQDAPSDGLVYGRKNLAWSTIIGGAVISDTPPGGPLQNGQLWYESDSGNTFIYYDDGDSQQWVQINIQPAPIPQTGLTADTRNRIVNGAFQVSQENGSTVTAIGLYNADQWFSSGNMGAATVQRVTNLTPTGSIYRWRFTVTTADTSVAVNDLLQLAITRLEGINVADFKWGTAGAYQVILRFGWKSPAGTYSFYIQGTGNSRFYIGNWTITAGQANTDTVQTFVIPGDTTGVWAQDNQSSMQIGFLIAGGTSWDGVLGWQSGTNLLKTSATSNGMATVGNVFELFDVGLYRDPLGTGVAPRWQTPDQIQETELCRRYWRTLYVYKQPIASSVYAGGTWEIAPIMRTPAATAYADWAGNSSKVSTGSGNNVAFAGGIGMGSTCDYVYADGTLPASQTYWWAVIIALNARM